MSITHFKVVFVGIITS